MGRVKARGWCRKHHDRWLRHGDPLKVAKRGKGALLAELKAAAAATGNECIILTGSNARPITKLEGKFMLASRAVWILAYGDPGEEHVLHTCHRGDEGCINIRHLYLGDNDQNIRDMVQAGHSTRGERSGTHKLKAHQVQQIRRLLRAKTPRATIAARYGVDPKTITLIKTGETWAWLPDPE